MTITNVLLPLLSLGALLFAVFDMVRTFRQTRKRRILLSPHDFSGREHKLRMEELDVEIAEARVHAKEAQETLFLNIKNMAEEITVLRAKVEEREEEVARLRARLAELGAGESSDG